MNDHDLIIRHDEQLRALSKLPAAIESLTDSIGQLNVRYSVSQGKLKTVIATTGIVCTILASFGTWLVTIFVK